MKNVWYTFLLLLLSAHFLSAQTESSSGMPELNLHVEGSTWLAINAVSVNIEGKFYSAPTEKFHLYGRGGLAYVNVNYLNILESYSSVGAILALAILTGVGDHHFEAVGGAFLGNFKSQHLFVSTADDNLGFKGLPVIDLGYRYQKPGPGIFFRAKVGILGLGVGFGYGF